MTYTTDQLRDYDRADVDAMLDWAADTIDRLTADNEHLRGIVFRNCNPANCAAGDSRPIEDVILDTMNHPLTEPGVSADKAAEAAERGES